MKQRASEVVRAVKKDKTPKLRVTVFPAEGGRPYIADVEPDDDGTFSIDDRYTYQITRASVWEENGIPRTIVNERNPQTVNAYTLHGNDVIHPLMFHGVVTNNLWEQLHEIGKRKSPWRSASTWGFMILGLCIVLLLLWQVKTLGSGLDELREAVASLRLSTGAPVGSGHQNIAPGGT